MGKRYLTLLLCAVILLGCLSGCGKAAPTTSSSSSTSAESTPTEPAESTEPEAPETTLSGVNPLTGLPMDKAYENSRPVAVMLNDLKAAQPQLGVSRADIIYEVPAEGGITRMLAIFQTLEGVGNLGSIRSTRPYYLELALGHDALLVHAGGSPEAYADIPVWGVDNMDGVNGGSDAKIFWRDPERRKHAGYEHSMLTSGEKILGYLAKGVFRSEHERGYTYPQMFTDDGTPAAGTAAEKITVKYSYYKTAAFTYDSATGKYLVGQYGKAYVDGNTGEQVGVTNVLILETSIGVISGDTAGRLSVKLTGSGDGTYCCGGKSVPIRWSKTGRDSPFVYTLTDGSRLVLGRGTSYVCIYSPKSGKVTVQ